MGYKEIRRIDISNFEIPLIYAIPPISFIVGFVVLRAIHIQEINYDTARYFLSALVQSQASIIAIVVTITLVAIQHTAATYTPRVIDIFKASLSMWAILIIYIISISYGCLILMLIEESQGLIINNFVGLIEFAFLLEILTLTALIPYMSRTIDLIKIENIIKSLSDKIAIGDNCEDNIQSIADIITRSIRDYDIKTVDKCLDALIVRFEKIDASDNDREKIEKVGRILVGSLTTCGWSAVRLERNGSTQKITHTLYKIGHLALKPDYSCDLINSIISAFDGIGIGAARRGLVQACDTIIHSLYELGEDSITKHSDCSSIALNDIVRAILRILINVPENDRSQLRDKVVINLVSLEKVKPNTVPRVLTELQAMLIKEDLDNIISDFKKMVRVDSLKSP